VALESNNEAKKKSVCLPSTRIMEFSKEEIAKHTSRDSCWLVANGRVYDATRFLHSHPAGDDCILRKAGGEDCAADLSFHTKKARDKWEHFKIGNVKGYTGDSGSCVIV
jgi:nitrate reductase (NAD(P)H)